jgi:hypothetical protein
MTEQQRVKAVASYIVLEECMQEYRTTLLWLTHGNHKETPYPTVKETRERISELKEKIIALLNDIEAYTR